MGRIKTIPLSCLSYLSCLVLGCRGLDRTGVARGRYRARLREPVKPFHFSGASPLPVGGRSRPANSKEGIGHYLPFPRLRDTISRMPTRLQLAEITAQLVRKKIKHLHLRVLPPDGAVRISAPQRMDLETIHRFALSKLDWIRAQRQKILAQAHPARLQYVDGENNPVWGKSVPLRVIESPQAPSVALLDDRLVVRVRPGSPKTKKQAVLDAWYREQVKQALPALIARWEVRLGVKVRRFYVQRMKTRWGSCNIRAQSIRLNTRLAELDPRYLEYVVVHELVHLLEASHNARFKGLMEQYLPGWREVRQGLKQGAL
jgi:predicted metal-dependent hydrolase